MSTNYISQITATDGVTYDVQEGVTTRIFRATCSTAVDTAAKVATLDDATGYSLTAGVRVAVTFTNGNSATSPTLNVNSGGAKYIYYRTNTFTVQAVDELCVWGANETVIFTYNGSSWVMMGSSLALYNAYNKAASSGSGTITEVKTNAGAHTTIDVTSGKAEFNVPTTAAHVGAATSDHVHGNITNGGDITATAPTIANGDQIIINDNSASKITNGPTFDGSTTTTALTPKGTWESFSKFSGSYNDLSDKPTIPTVPTNLTWYGTSSTTASTAAKVVTCSNFALSTGVVIGVLFSTANTAATPTLNVNSTGAKSIYVGNSAPSSTTNVLKWSANTMVYFMYDGTQFRYITSVSAGDVIPSRGANTWYGTSSTSASTQAKTSTIDNYVLTKGSIVVITFSTANTYTSAKITLNINSTGAKDVYYNGVVTSSTNTLLWNVNETLTFIYDGTGYYFVSKNVSPAITLNGSSTNSPNFYAPTSAGTSGYYLKSNGNGAPSWTAFPTIPTKVSDLTNDSNYVTTDEKVKQTTDNSANNKRILFSNGSNNSEETAGVYKSDYFKVVGDTLYFTNANNKQATADAEGFAVYTSTSSAYYSCLYNDILRFKPNSYSVDIGVITPTNSRTINFPNASGTVALTSDIPDVSGFITTDSDENVKSTAVTAATTNYLVGSTTSTTTTGGLSKHASGVLYTTADSGTSGYTQLRLGNTTATTSAGGKEGQIRLYGTDATYYLELKPGAITSNSKTITFPNKTGTVALIPTEGAGGPGTKAVVYNTTDGFVSIKGAYFYRSTSDNKCYLSLGGNANEGKGSIQLHTSDTNWAVELTPIDSLSTNRTITLPNKDGTVALTSDVPTNWENGSATGSVRTSGSSTDGVQADAAGSYSVSEGRYTVATGTAAHAEGYQTRASGDYSHVEGGNNTASGNYSHAGGYNTTAQRKSQTTIGEFNILDTAGTDTTTKGDYIFIVGNGTDSSARSNAMTVDWSGNLAISGSLTIGLETSETLYTAINTAGWVSAVIV